MPIVTREQNRGLWVPLILFLSLLLMTVSPYKQLSWCHGRAGSKTGQKASLTEVLRSSVSGDLIVLLVYRGGNRGMERAFFLLLLEKGFGPDLSHVARSLLSCRV